MLFRSVSQSRYHSTNIAKNGYRVGILSAEMSEDMLGARALQSDLGISSKRIILMRRMKMRDKIRDIHTVLLLMWFSIILASCQVQSKQDDIIKELREIKQELRNDNAQ